jgi:hypothetical protein
MTNSFHFGESIFVDREPGAKIRGQRSEAGGQGHRSG